MDLEELRQEIGLLCELEYRGHQYEVLDYTLGREEEIETELARICEDIRLFGERHNIRLVVVAS